MKKSIALASFVAFSFLNLQAVDYIWDTPGSGEWTDNNNWLPNTGFPSSSADTATFAATDISPIEISTSSAVTTDSILLLSSTPYDLIGPGTITLGGAVPSQIFGSNNTHTISAEIVLASNIEIEQLAPDQMILAGTISGAFGITCIEDGLVTFGNSSNAFSQGLSINNGTAQAAVAGALGTGAINMGGGTLNITGTTTLTHSISLQSPVATFAIDQTATISNPISETVPANLQKTGSGTLVLVNSNTYTGGTTITGGQIQVADFTPLNTGTIFLQGGTLHITSTPLSATTLPISLPSPGGQIIIDQSAIFSGTISGSGSLTKSGSGLLEFDNSNTGGNIYSGGTFINSDSIQINNALDLGIGTLYFNDAPFQNATLIVPSPLSITLNNPVALSQDATIIPQAGAELVLQGTISGPGQITYPGPGELRLQGSNTNTGTITVAGGILHVTSDQNFGDPAFAPVFLSGGSIALDGSVISPSRSFVLSSGTLSFINATSGASILGGTISGTSGLGLGGTAPILLASNNTYQGNTYLASGSALYITSDQNLGLSSGTLLLDGGTLGLFDSITTSRAVNILSPSTIDTLSGSESVFSSTITSSSDLFITGSGKIDLAGTATFTGASCTVSSAHLAVNGDFTATTLQINANAILSGQGTITANVNLDGTLQPGNSIGTIHLVGNQVFSATSTLDNEYTMTTSDLVDITGDLTIQSGATLQLLPQGPIMLGLNLPIVQTSGNITGEFTNVMGFSDSFLTTETLLYLPNQILLTVQVAPFSSLNFPGNAGRVGAMLDQGFPTSDPDLTSVMAALLNSPSPQDLRLALNQLQPSMLKGLSLAQENSAIRFRESIGNRTYNLTSNACHETKPDKIFLWTDFLGDYMKQHAKHLEAGLSSFSGQAALGLDYLSSHDFYFGGALGYSFSSLHWNASRGHGKIDSGYGAIYGGYSIPHFFVQAVLEGAFNHYSTKRSINFVGISRTANGDFNGGELLAHIDLGTRFTLDTFQVSPFISTEYIYLRQQSFQETGAGSIDLYVKATNYHLVRSEAGFHLSRCFPLKKQSDLRFDLNLSYIREDRFGGNTYYTSWVSINREFTVSGLAPDRNIFSPGFALTYSKKAGRYQCSFSYDAEIASSYLDQNLSLLLAYRF